MVDTSIIMQAARTPNINLPDILQRSAESAAAIENLPLLRRQQEAQAQVAEQSAAQQQSQIQRNEQLHNRQESIRKAGIIYNYGKQARALPQEQRRTYFNTIDKDIIRDLGFDDQSFAKIATDNGSLDTMLAQIEPIIQSEQGQSSSPAELQTFNALTEGLSEDDIEQAKRVRLGLGARSKGNKNVDIGGVPYILNQDTGTLTPVEVGGSQVTADTVGGSKGKIKALETQAAESAKDVQEFISAAVPTLNKIESNISNYDDVLNAIDSGARSGAIVSRLPSINEASKDLEVLRNKLGLDVVGMASFGALSEGELKLALDTALPTNKDPEYLRGWVTDKRDAQIKAAEVLRDSVAFLNNGGTIADLIELGRNRRKEQEKTPANTGGASTDEFEGFEIIE